MSSLIIRCSHEDAARIRNHASSEHRSLSGYLLHVLERSLWIEDRLTRGLTKSLLLAQAGSIKSARRKKKIRTALHLRCTAEQAEKIREYAARRHLSISDFVVFSLRRSWDAIEHLYPHGKSRPRKIPSLHD